MKRCRAWQKQIPEALYGELDMKIREKLDRHIDSCEKCSKLYGSMSKTLWTMNQMSVPDPGAEFWDGYWERLERRMAQEITSRTDRFAGAASPAHYSRGLLRIPRWAYGAAGAALLLATGIFIGRTLFRPARDLARSASASLSTSMPATAEAALAVRASRYLERSRVLLLAVVNYDPLSDDLYGLNLPLQRKTSEELILEAAVLKKELRSSDRRLERLVSELEIILVQIANLRSETDVSAVEIIKSGVESTDILFKINLSGIRRSSGKAGTMPAPPEPTADDKRKNVKSTSAT